MSGTDQRPRRPRSRAAAADNTTTWSGLPAGARVMAGTAPIIYLLEGNPRFLPSFIGLFEAEAAGELQIVISTITLAEVLTGPLRAGNDAWAQRYERALGHYLVTPVTSPVAALAARMRARYGLKLPDALQLATALKQEAAALVTHDRDFARVEGLTILRGENTTAGSA